jgi:hypothetical protein
VLSRTLLASLLSVSALGTMPSDTGAVFESSSSSAEAHRATDSSADDGAPVDHPPGAARHHHRHVRR